MIIITTHGFAAIILDASQEAFLEQVPRLPHTADTDNAEAPGGRCQLGADGGGQGPDVATQHAASLLKQPGAEAVPVHRGLGYAPGERGKVCLAEAVIAVGQQPEPGDGYGH